MDKFVTRTKANSSYGPAEPCKRKRTSETRVDLITNEPIRVASFFLDGGMSKQDHITRVCSVPSGKGRDIWQSHSSGHQVSEDGGKASSYNEVRAAKLQIQLRPEQKHELGNFFKGLVFYLDGYMGPSQSDYTLKHQITLHGGTISISLARRKVTHLIISDNQALASSKIKKEVEATRNSVKIVRVGWLLECLKLGKRIGEEGWGLDRMRGSNHGIFEFMPRKATLQNNSKSDPTKAQR